MSFLPTRRARALFVLALTTATPFVASQTPLAPPTPADWNARIAAHVEAARTRTLAACTEKGIALPADFLQWIDGDPLRRASVYGCRAEPLPVLLQLRSLEIDLGPDLVRRDYPQLAIAFAIQASYHKPKREASGWNDGDGDAGDAALPDVRPRPPLVLTIPGDPRVPVDTKDGKRALDRQDHIVNFLEDHAEVEVEVKSRELPPLEYDDKGIAKPRGKATLVTRKVLRKPLAADVIASATLQQEFTSYMAAHGHPDVRIDCGERAVHWYSEEAVHDKALRDRIAAAHTLFHDAYRAKGRMPKERDQAPTPAESMAWLVRNDRHAFTAADRAARKWPRFPLNAPWPLLLMLAADDQPLREREDIWLRFRDHGEMKTYGEYIGGIAQQFDMQSARRVSPFAFSYGSIQMMWKDGGVCGTMGNIGARTYRICGVPSSTAGQPGHCAIVLMEHDAATGQFRCKGGQYATGGDEVTTVHAGFHFDERGGRRPMVLWQSIAWGCSHGVASFIDTLVMQRAWATLPAAQRQQECLAFASAGLTRNPFAVVALEAAMADAPDAKTLLALADAFAQLASTSTDAKEHALYRTTVRDLVHARILQLPTPATVADNQALLAELERQGCSDEKLLARTWRAIDGEAGFTARCKTAAERYLADADRSKNKKASVAFAAETKAWSDTVKGKAAKAAWANEMLATFAGFEVLEVKGKKSIDPAVALLCKLAGREVPAVPGAK